ncbi:MAG: hypothetical protein ABSF75_12745, partial [Terracidiphilus sp.]
FPHGEGSFTPVTSSKSEALLAEISASVLNPDACFFLPAHPTGGSRPKLQPTRSICFAWRRAKARQ